MILPMRLWLLSMAGTSTPDPLYVSGTARPRAVALKEFAPAPPPARPARLREAVRGGPRAAAYSPPSAPRTMRSIMSSPILLTKRVNFSLSSVMYSIST